MWRLVRRRDAFTARVLAAIRDGGDGFRPTLSAQVTRIGVGAALGVVAVAGYVASLLHPEVASESVLKALATVAAGGTFLLGYVQWHLSRHEASFDKYYDRLATVNSYIDEIGKREAGDDGAQLLEHYYAMRVFAQLDSLEYVLGKYRLQFVNIDIVERAFRTFRSECEVDDFRRVLGAWLAGAGRKVPERLGYDASTRRAAGLSPSTTRMPDRDRFWPG